MSLARLTKSGPVRGRHLLVPPVSLGDPFNLPQAIVVFLPTTIYVFTVVASGFQKHWVNVFALPDVVFGVILEKDAIRVLACLLVNSVLRNKVFEYLICHTIGRCEKLRIAQTVPYAWRCNIMHGVPVPYVLVLRSMVRAIALALIFSFKVSPRYLRDNKIDDLVGVGSAPKSSNDIIASTILYQVSSLFACLLISAMFSTNQLLEIFIVLCTVDHFRYTFSKVGDATVKARSKSGPVRPESMPTRLSVLISPIDGLVYFFIPTLYVVSVVAAGCQQPQWMRPLALPDVVRGVELDPALRKSTVRVAASVASIAMQSLMDHVFDHLGDQFHAIGRREKSRIVQTGPYAWVRHPLYSLSLSQTALWTFMYWSYAPLFVLVVAAVVTVVKIRIEEDAILRDDGAKEYPAYMRKVPAKLVPYVW